MRLLDFNFQDGTPYLVLDYAPQGSLTTRHPHGQKVPLATVMAYLKQIVQALQFAFTEPKQPLVLDYPLLVDLHEISLYTRQGDKMSFG